MPISRSDQFRQNQIRSDQKIIPNAFRILHLYVRVCANSILHIYIYVYLLPFIIPISSTQPLISTLINILFIKLHILYFRSQCHITLSNQFLHLSIKFSHHLILFPFLFQLFRLPCFCFSCCWTFI